MLVTVVAAVPRFAVLLALCYGGGALHAAGWPVFRGTPALTGIASETLPSSLGLLWSFKTGAPVKSSAVIGDGRAFIGSDDGKIHALNFASGQEEWTFNAGSAVQAPPLLSGNALYVGTVEGIFYALDAGDGRLLWKFTTEGKILASANTVPGQDGPPRILVGSYDFKLYCLDATNGKPVWTYETGNYINGSCAVADGQTVFGGCDAMLHVLSLADGAQDQGNRRRRLHRGLGRAGGRPRLFRPLRKRISLRGHQRGQSGLALSRFGFSLSWRRRRSRRTASFLAAMTRPCIASNRADGTSVWKFATRGKIESSPVVAGGKVVFGSDDGNVYMRVAGGGQGALVL